MAGRQAKIISPVQLDVLLAHVRGRKDYLRSRAIILLSARAGLRAAEIAQLEWTMVLDLDVARDVLAITVGQPSAPELSNGIWKHLLYES